MNEVKEGGFNRLILKKLTQSLHIWERIPMVIFRSPVMYTVIILVHCVTVNLWFSQNVYSGLIISLYIITIRNCGVFFAFAFHVWLWGKVLCSFSL